MLADEVRAVRFRKAPIGSRGYDEEDVDEFLDSIEAALRGVREMDLDELSDPNLGRSPLGKRGYRYEDVDAFVERVIAEWPGSADSASGTAPSPRSTAGPDTAQLLAGLAQEVLEHESCFGCRCNAANALEHLGLLDQVLTRLGKDDPRRLLPAGVGTDSAHRDHRDG
jgi:DivIVA domain-containing protein